MSIASKLKDLAISMGAEVTTDDDSIEEILAKMKGHTGGSYCLKIRSRTESTTVTPAGGSSTNDGNVTPGTGPAVDPSTIELTNIVYEIDESYSEIVLMLKNGTYVYGIEEQNIPDSEENSGEYNNVYSVNGFSSVTMPSGITGFIVVLTNFNSSIELYALNPDDPMTSVQPDIDNSGSASDTDNPAIGGVVTGDDGTPVVVNPPV